MSQNQNKGVIEVELYVVFTFVHHEGIEYVGIYDDLNLAKEKLKEKVNKKLTEITYSNDGGYIHLIELNSEKRELIYALDVAYVSKDEYEIRERLIE